MVQSVIYVLRFTIKITFVASLNDRCSLKYGACLRGKVFRPDQYTHQNDCSFSIKNKILS